MTSSAYGQLEDHSECAVAPSLTPALTYKNIKGSKRARQLINDYQQVKWSNLRNHQVTNFFKQSAQLNLHEDEKRLEQNSALRRPDPERSRVNSLKKVGAQSGIPPSV